MTLRNVVSNGKEQTVVFLTWKEKFSMLKEAIHNTIYTPEMLKKFATDLDGDIFPTEAPSGE
jgi:cytoplasmic iron level regulating protein YaaA (DUF328/UPF0246 family)